jgi:anti-sigma factor RsiW
MDCADVAERLVALEDGELGPSEERLVRRHLAACPACTRTAERLAAVVPRPGLAVPLAVRARLSALDGEAMRIAGARRPAAWRWPTAAVVVPTPAAIGYAVLLLLSIAWGVANWREREVLEARLATPPPAGVAAPEIPAADYRPASWTPESSSESP